MQQRGRGREGRLQQLPRLSRMPGLLPGVHLKRVRPTSPAEDFHCIDLSVSP